MQARASPQHEIIAVNDDIPYYFTAHFMIDISKYNKYMYTKT